MSVNAIAQATELLSAVKVAGKGEIYRLPPGTNVRTCQAILRGTGAVTATVTISGSNSDDADSFVLMDTYELTGTTDVSGGKPVQNTWAYLQAELVSITGTDASLDFIVGV